MNCKPLPETMRAELAERVKRDGVKQVARTLKTSVPTLKGGIAGCDVQPATETHLAVQLSSCA